MIELDIPGRGIVKLNHLVSDVNGTLAKDGRLLDQVVRPLSALRDRVTIHLLTADTYGRQDSIDHMLGLTAVRVQPGDEGRQKADYVRGLGASSVIALGNGDNDAEMLAAAAIGIAVLGDEGLAARALASADIVTRSIYDALGLLGNPARLVATLRR